MKIKPGNRISNISKVKLQLLKPNHFWINNPFHIYPIHISIATLTMPTWLGEIHIWQTCHIKLSSQQKHAIRMTCNERKFERTKQLLQSNNILNVYKLNVLNVATFMYKINQKTSSRFWKLSDFYPTRSSEVNHVQPIHNIKASKHSISIRGSYICNSFLRFEEKQAMTMHKLKGITKSGLLFLENELVSF